MKKETRRSFIKSGLLGSIFAYVSTAKAEMPAKLLATPPEIEGPFYPITPQKDKDFDLTKVEGKSETAKGKVIWIEGQVVDIYSRPVENATVDIWQANAAGRYAHPHDSNPAPLDPNFQGWAIVQSGKNGGFKFKTIMPGAYPASKDWDRPPHIHFKVSKRGYVEITTQMYFPGHPLNEPDFLLQRKDAKEKQSMISTKVNDNPESYLYRVVLEKA